MPAAGKRWPCEVGWGVRGVWAKGVWAEAEAGGGRREAEGGRREAGGGGRRLEVAHR